MIVKSSTVSLPQPIAPSRAEIREELTELLAQLFERELRAELAAEADELARLRLLHNAPTRDVDAEGDHM
jgi:hypothetical protein